MPVYVCDETLCKAEEEENQQQSPAYCNATVSAHAAGFQTHAQ